MGNGHVGGHVHKEWEPCTRDLAINSMDTPGNFVLFPLKSHPGHSEWHLNAPNKIIVDEVLKQKHPILQFNTSKPLSRGMNGVQRRPVMYFICHS